MVPKNDSTSFATTTLQRYRIVFMSAIVMFIVAAATAMGGRATGWESGLFHTINGWPESWYRVMIVVTFFGSMVWAPCAVAIILLSRQYRLAWRLAFTILGAYAFAAIFKHLIDRERPLGLLQDVHARVAETGMGFPSGHATLITVIALTLLPYVSVRWRWLLAVPILLVCVSRLYLGVHTPLDVIGGVALGTAAVAFCRVLPYSLRRLLRIH
jgi:membrane-associated phospholipid phosphatase